jgi:hypothetical protein
LYASQSNASGTSGRVILESTAQLLANATGSASDTGAGSAGNGGYVVISASNADGSLASGVDGGASIDLKSGSVIDVSGRNELGEIVPRGGSVVLRAPRTSGNDDIAIKSLAGEIRNSTDTRLEAVKTYSATTIKGTDEGGDLSAGSEGDMFTDATTFASNATAILSRLGTSSAQVKLSPGIEVRSTGDLTVSVNETSTTLADRGWDLSGWRFPDGASGTLIPTLTLRAKGNLNILGSISDGFDKPDDTALAMPNWAMSSDASSSLRLVGGADLSAANPLTVLSAAKLDSGKGDVLIDFARKTTDSDVPVSITDMPVATVRTGTGRIDVAAGRDVTLGMSPLFRVINPDDVTVDSTPDPLMEYPDYKGGYLITQVGASLYTAGKSVASNAYQPTPLNPLNTLYGPSDRTPASAAFGAGGGAVTVVAGRNVNGPRRGDIANQANREDSYYRLPGTAADDTSPAILGDKVYVQMALPNLVNSWLFRQGRTNADGTFETPSNNGTQGDTLATAWWARTEYFNQGIATLGGGDIHVHAAGNVNDLSVSAATNARMDTSTNTLLEQGGGDVSVRAGQNIRGGALYVQKGSGLLRADGSITSGNLAGTPGDASTALNPVIALGDAKVSVIAGASASIENAYNPTLAPQNLINFGAKLNTANQNVTDLSGNKNFLTGVYKDGIWDSSSEDYQSQRYAFAQFSNFSSYGSSSSIRVTSVGGSVLMMNNKNAYRNAAEGDIFVNEIDSPDPSIGFYTYSPPTVGLYSLAGDVGIRNGFVMAPNKFGQLSLQAKGSIDLKIVSGSSILMLDTDPQTMSTSAAPRIMNEVELAVINGSSSSPINSHIAGGLHSDDSVPVNIIALDGDINGSITRPFTIDIPKAVNIFAGSDIRDLGIRIQHNHSSDVSRINAGRDFIDSILTQDNYLENVIGGSGRLELNAGRNIDLGTGNGFRTRGSLDNPYLADGGASLVMRAGVDTANINYDTFVNNYVATYFPDRLENLKSLLTNQDYLGLNAAFFQILRETSKNSAIKPLTTGKSLASQLVTPFDKAIASLLVPSGLGGDVSVFKSQIKTEQGGSIDLFVPFGSIYAGLTDPTGIKAANQGIFTIRGGAINSVVYKDFLVNQGRVFTLGGGDIELVSQTSNIDAGRGAKTASSAPPPIVTISANGIVQIDVSSSISGSGIATLQTKTGQLPSNVYPIAPRGTFDAGDAGVRSSGSVEVTANLVLNGNNITASGSISGSQVPVAAAPAPSAPASSASTQQTKASQTAAPDTGRKETALNVELLGYGSQDVDPKDSTKPSKSDKSKKKDEEQ